MISGPAASVSLENLLEIHILMSNTRPAESETLTVGSSFRDFNKSCR